MKYRSPSHAHVERTAMHYDLVRIGRSGHAGQGHICYDLTFYARIGLAALLFALIAWALLATGVAAHAVMVKSDPESEEVREQSPEQVVAWFSEELDAGPSTMQVFDTQGRQVDDGDGGVDLNDPDHASMVVSLSELLPNGVYTVRWVAVSAEDDDLTEGEFTFAVGSGVVAEEPASTPAEAGLNPGLLVAVGVAVVGLLLLVGVVVARRRLTEHP